MKYDFVEKLRNKNLKRQRKRSERILKRKIKYARFICDLKYIFLNKGFTKFKDYSGELKEYFENHPCYKIEIIEDKFLTVEINVAVNVRRVPTLPF